MYELQKIEMEVEKSQFHVFTWKERNVYRKNDNSIIIRGRENRVSPKPNIRTDGHTDGRT